LDSRSIVHKEFISEEEEEEEEKKKKKKEELHMYSFNHS
jgi:hypothetical protein